MNFLQELTLKAFTLNRIPTAAKSVAIAASFVFTTSYAADESNCDCETDTYPTHVIADYVLACMSANGNSYESLHQCSCSIDLIKSKMSHEDYVTAQTIMQVQLDKGQRGIFYRDSSWAKSKLKLLQKLQAESTLKCF